MPEDPLLRLERYHPPSADDGVNPPIADSSTFAFRDPEKLKAMFGDDAPGCFLYARSGNATTRALAGALAALEDTEAAHVTASGMAAIVATLMQLAGAGGEIIGDYAIYGGSYSLLANFLPRFGIETHFVDINDADAVRAAITDATTALYCETISNPLLRVADIPALAAIAHEADVPLVVDNTFAPLIASPAAFGADIVVHSLTKFINGAGDGLGGVICANREFVAALDDVSAGTAMLLGAALDPLRAQSIYKNLATLGVRMIRHGENALYLAERLEEAGLRVIYPGLASHPDRERLSAWMNPGYGYGGMLTLDAGSAETADELAVCLQEAGVGHLAVSLGHYGTLFSPSSGSTSSEIPPELRAAAGLTPGLLRFSIGLDADVASTWQRFERCLTQVGML